ncbi:MAG: N-6 DNA methylase [Deltaproteobacteria bacterium]|nr:N-6 DNA methylase [Deltaproteobacteria bacterium]
MTTATKMSALVQAHCSPPAGMIFYDSLESIRNDIRLIGYWSVIERAWSEIKLNGVLFIDGRPVLYLKEHSRPFASTERMRLQKLFWNQGVANILVLADPKTVYIYSGLDTPPRDESDIVDRKKGLVEVFKLVDYAQRIQSLFHDLATGHYYEARQDYFDPEQAVDSWLLNNLRALRSALTEGDEGLHIKDAHAFIGRVLFLCYLLDREIISVGNANRDHTGTMLLASLLEQRSHQERVDYLYGLFNDLKVRFNGNMFDQDLHAEKKLIRPTHLKKLTLFLGGHSVKSGQRTLGFWAYDFKMIPIETISAIYQDFLGAEDEKKQRKRGAFYTPRFLVEMVVDTAIRDERNAFGWSYLDPACGSGIFLVTLFNRLANFWLHTQPSRVHYTTKAKALQGILRSQIRGVDVEETACRISCFSLYLAYLDFFNPPDLKNYVERTGSPLPKLLDYGKEHDRPTADIPVIHNANFLAEDIFSTESFDCIVGNPPWEGRQRKQIAQRFLENAPNLLKKDGTGCLLLPTKILQNQTDTFQGEWLRQVTLDRVIQLADYRFLLFHNALCPAIIARFTNKPPRVDQHQIEFNAPKFNRNGLRKGVIIVAPSASTWISLASLLEATKKKAAPVVWKRRLWGTQRDQKLLDLLQSLPPLSDIAGTPNEGKRWIKGQGFQPNTSGKSKNPKSAWWNKSDLYIAANASCWDSSCLIIQQEDCEEVGNRFPSLHRPRNRRIYQGPLVLVSQGFGKVAFCDFDVLFQHSLQSISGPPEDTNLFKFLAAYLRSDLAKYFLFHTASNWGSERDKVHLFEMLRVPFPLPGDSFISPNAEEIITKVVEKLDRLHAELQETRSRLKSNSRRRRFFDEFDDNDKSFPKQWRKERNIRINALQRELEPLIYDYFGLTKQEIILIQDTIRIFEPSATPTTWNTGLTATLDPVEKATVPPYNDHGLKAYADTLTSTLNYWADSEGSVHRVWAEGGTDNETGLAMVTVHLSDVDMAFKEIILPEDLTNILKELHMQASRKRGPLIYERDILHFDRTRMYIVRPNLLLNWTQTMALNDAARIYGEITLSKEGS